MAGIERAWSRSAPSASRILPEEVVVWEILVRLPAKELLRCRAVCQSWRRLTSAIDFLLAHHLRQPSLPLVAFHGKDRNKGGYFDSVVDAFDHRLLPAERRRPVLGYRDHRNGRRVVLHASCDGLILLSSPGRFDICNPATRQWASLPALVGGHVAGLYPHGSSGEYRILYWKQRLMGYNPVYYVLVVGSLEPRCIQVPIALACMYRSSFRPPTFLHSCLHWIQGRDRLVVFDTVDESFRSMGSPVGDDWDPYLHEMEGMLRISCINSTMLKVWVLLDYEKEIWSLKYHIKFPKVCPSIDKSFGNCTLVSEKGDTLFFSSYPAAHMFHCNNNGKRLEEFRWESCDPHNTEHLFKESLVRHAFFPERDSSKEPHFLRGLGAKRHLLSN